MFFGGSASGALIRRAGSEFGVGGGLCFGGYGNHKGLCFEGNRAGQGLSNTDGAKATAKALGVCDKFVTLRPPGRDCPSSRQNGGG